MVSENDKSQYVSFIELFNENLNSEISENLESVAFFVFGYDKDVIQPLIDEEIPILIVRDNKNFSSKFHKVKHSEKNLREICPPKILNSQNSSFHLKLYLIKFESFLRVVIGSANLFKNDWKNWNNILWIEDFEEQEEI